MGNKMMFSSPGQEIKHSTEVILVWDPTEPQSETVVNAS